MIGKQGNGVQKFFRCSYCERKVVVSTEGGFEDCWWADGFETRTELPETCPCCANYETFVEQAELGLIEVFYDWGYRQWSETGVHNGWRIKVEIGR
jgi:hypothetical protein